MERVRMGWGESFLACFVGGLKTEEGLAFFDDKAVKVDAVDGGHAFADAGFDAFADGRVGKGALSRCLRGVVMADKAFAVRTFAF